MSRSAAPARPTDIWARLAEPRFVISVLFLYCIAHFLIRLMLSPNFSLDESEQVLFGQSLQWGYRFRNGPLYTWLAWAALQSTGVSRAGFFLLKYVIMAAGLAAYFGAARLVIRDTRLAALASFGLITTLVFGYLSHINFMHSIMVGTMIAAYLWMDARAIQSGRTSDYLWLGVIAGLGLLSKYIFILVPLSMAVGVAFAPALRSRLRLWPLLGAFAIAAAIVAPYAWWSATHHYSLVTLAEGATRAQGPSFSPLAWLADSGNFVLTLLDFIVPFIPIFPLIYWQASKPLPREAGDETDRAWLKAYGIAMLVSGVLMWAAVLLLGASELNQRWMYPVLMPLPIWLFLRAKMAGPSERAGKRFLVVAAVLAAAVLVIRPAFYFLGSTHCQKCREYWPMRDYATALERSGFSTGTIIAEGYDLGGAFYYVMPQARVTTPAFAPQIFGPPKGGSCLLVWRGRGDVPKKELAYARKALGASIGPNAVRGDVMAPFLTNPNKRDTLSYLLVPAGSGNCN